MSIIKRSFVFFLSSSFLVGCAASPDAYSDMDEIRCEEEGGTCTSNPSLICEPGKAPLTADDPQRTDCIGHCCITPDAQGSCNPAPASSGTDAAVDISGYNCVPDEDGVECPGFWKKVSGNLLCESGRSCCYRSF